MGWETNPQTTIEGEVMKISREFYTTGMEKVVEDKDLKIEVYFSNKNDTLVGMYFTGRKAKPDKYLRFKTNEERLQYTNKFIEDAQYLKNLKDERKIAKKEAQEKLLKSIKVGDVFVSSWGYEQTNINFYQVIDIKGKTVTFREIAKDVEEDGYMSGKARAVKNNFIGDAFKKQIRSEYINLNSVQSIRKVQDPEHDVFYCSWYY